MGQLPEKAISLVETVGDVKNLNKEKFKKGPFIHNSNYFVIR